MDIQFKAYSVITHQKPLIPQANLHVIEKEQEA